VSQPKPFALRHANSELCNTTLTHVQKNFFGVQCIFEGVRGLEEAHKLQLRVLQYNLKKLAP